VEDGKIGLLNEVETMCGILLLGTLDHLAANVHTSISEIAKMLPKDRGKTAHGTSDIENGHPLAK